MAKTLAPGPSMVIFFEISNGELTVITPVTEKLILSPSFASIKACLNDPEPLSFVVVTVIVEIFPCTSPLNSSEDIFPQELPVASTHVPKELFGGLGKEGVVL